jgi:hypothetical protein
MRQEMRRLDDRSRRALFALRQPERSLHTAVQRVLNAQAKTGKVAPFLGGPRRPQF